jgi:DNA-binding Lrp family transcriptional regulator
MIKEILKILENDARTTTKQISTMTGISTAEVTKLA